MDTLLVAVDHDAAYALAFCDGGYTSYLSLVDLTDGALAHVAPLMEDAVDGGRAQPCLTGDFPDRVRVRHGGS